LKYVGKIQALKEINQRQIDTHNEILKLKLWWLHLKRKNQKLYLES
jgi:hypothetical protein